MDAAYWQTVGQWEQLFNERKDMPKIGEMMESKYLKQSDIDEEALVTVKKVGQGNIAREDDPPEMKWMVAFAEMKKPMVLNSTNIQLLAKACESDDTDNWIGKKVILYVDHSISFQGKVVGGIRIKPAPKSKKPAPIVDDNEGNLDDVPFN